MAGGLAGRNLDFSLTNSAATPVNLSIYLNKLGANDTVGQDDITTFGAAVVAKSYCVTLTEGGFTIDAPYHATLDAHLVGLKGLLAASAFFFGPKGSTAGFPKTSGNCRMKSYKRDGDVGGVLRCSAEFIYDGTITEGVY